MKGTGRNDFFIEDGQFEGHNIDLRKCESGVFGGGKLTFEDFRDELSYLRSDPHSASATCDDGDCLGV